MSKQTEIKAVFKAETSEMDASLSKTRSEMSRLGSELKLNSEQMKNAGVNADTLAQRQGILSQQLEQNKEKQEALTQKIEVAKRLYGENSKEVNSLKTSLNYAKIEEEKIRSEIEKTNNALDGSADSFEKASGGVDVYSVALGNLAADAAEAAISKLGEVSEAVIDVGSSFEASMSKVSALSGASGDDIDALTAKAKELGSSTTFTASQAADALGYMALAGYDTEQSLAAIDGVLQLAQAGEMDLAAASDLVTDYLSAFGMQAEDSGRLVDVLAFAQGNANTTTEALGNAFKNCSANANAAGMDVETVTAAISMMSNQGLKGSEAGTALNAVMRDMTAKMQDGAIAIGDTSVAVTDADGNYRDFAAILADIESATNGMGDAQRAAALQATFTADSTKGLNLLLNSGSGELSSFRDSLYDCSGAAEQMASTMTDNLQGDLDELNSGLEGVSINLYEKVAPTLRDIAGFATNNIVPFLSWCTNNLPIVGFILGGLAAGLVVLNSNLIATKAVAMAATAQQWLMNAAMSANPIGAVIIAITALIAIGIALYENCEGFRVFVDGMFSSISSVVGGFVLFFTGTIVPGISSGIDVVGGFFISFGETVSGEIITVAGIIEAFSADPFGTLRDAVLGIISWWTENFKLPKIEFPRFEVPEFHITGSWNPVDWFTKGAWPHVEVTWHAKAMNNAMVLKQPTIFGYANGSFLGGGEAGNEVVAGERHLIGLIESAVARNTASSTVVNQFGDISINAKDLKDIATIDQFVDMIRSTKNAYPTRW